jgi:hypothetical protein
MNEHNPDRKVAGAPPADALDALASLRRPAPPGFARRVMARLPERPGVRRTAGWRPWWPDGRRWLAPALAGACAALLVVAVGLPARRAAAPDRLTVHFALRAPGAQSVELVGNFTGWQTGRILLLGPDASGHWTADVELPPGRHEYAFLVDGQEWVADPLAEILRPDGFGRENAVMDL